VAGWLLERGRQGGQPHQGTYLNAHYHRVRGRRGPGKATMAVAHSVLVIADHVLDQGVAYQELGDDYFQQRHSAEHHQRQLVRQLERLGHKVTLEPIRGGLTRQRQAAPTLRALSTQDVLCRPAA
jgi:transposase